MSRLIPLGLIAASAYFDSETGDTIIDSDSMHPLDGPQPNLAGEDDAYYGEEDNGEYGDREDRLRRRRERIDNRDERQDRRHDRRRERIDDKLDDLRDDEPRGRAPRSEGSWEMKPLQAADEATSTSNQKVTLTVQDQVFKIHSLTLDGTTSGVYVTSITVGPDTVFRAQGSVGLPASAFTGEKFANLRNLNGRQLTAGQQIVVEFTPTASGDVLSFLAQGEAWRPHGRC